MLQLVVSLVFLICFDMTVTYGQDVLIVSATVEENREDVRTKIKNSGAITGRVDAFDATASTPSAEILAGYDAILAFSDYSLWANSDLIGNRLADFVDAGGLVVAATFAFHKVSSLAIGGRWRDEGYEVWARSDVNSGQNLTLGTVHYPSHPLVKGVRAFSGGISWRHRATVLTDQAEIIAEWSNGQALIVVNDSQFAAPIVGLNFFPPSSDVNRSFWSKDTDGVRILTNALIYGSRRDLRHHCVVRSQKVFCWGSNLSGQLGLGHTELVGDESGEMGEHLRPVDLGSKFITDTANTNGRFSCALSKEQLLKCWGSNSAGQLGQGHTNNIGDDSGEMGAALPYVDFGDGVKVSKFAMGAEHLCVVTADKRLKCIGANKHGQLGYGDVQNRGDTAEEMGAALPYVDFGGRLVEDVVAGDDHTCVLFVDKSMACFGNGSKGQLGNGMTIDIGGLPGQMGESLRAISLGSGGEVSSITSGADFNCAKMQSGALKCFGGNRFGQLGQGDTVDRGSTPGQMGNALMSIDLGRGEVVDNLVCQSHNCCALLIQGTMKCWGRNNFGQLGYGDTVDRGSRPEHMGRALQSYALRPLGRLNALAIKLNHICASDDLGWKCWGDNRRGVLGYEQIFARGSIRRPQEQDYVSLPD